MSYQVLARKWRPREFGSLIGQEHVVRALRHALEHQRLHHAYLFTGTRGVGKTTLARILAKCLNCEAGITADPCGRCAACREIDGGRFPDYVELDAASNRGVEEMTQLLERAIYAPTSGRFKVTVIDEVHQLSGHAFNAMLKTLEEPPQHLKFVLATTDPQKIPVTVLSRCLQFNLKQMPRAVIAAHLGKILADEKIPFDAEALALIGRAASGSMRDALSLLDQAIAHGGGQVRDAGVRDMLGTIDETYLLRLIEAVAAGDGAQLMRIADEMQARSLSFDAALADLASLLLRIALAQSVPAALDPDLPERARIADLAARLDPETVQLDYQIALQGREDLPLAPDEHAGFAMTLLRMLAFRPEGNAQAMPLPQPVAAQASADDWPRLVRELPVTGATRELARNAQLRRREGGVFELLLPKSQAHLAERGYQDKLRAALERHLGQAVTLRVSAGEIDGPTTAGLEAGERDTRRAEAARAARGEPVVQDLVDLFDATVIDPTARPAGRDS